MNPLALLKSQAAPRRRSEAVYHAVKRRILLGDVRSGDPLLETELASAMDCSQGTVREALMRLQQDGLVTRRGYRGTVVSATSTAEAALLTELRIRIETAAAAGAATNGKADDFERLEDIVGVMRERDGACDSYGLSELDQAFHRTILHMAGFASVEPILLRCMLHIHRHTVGNPSRRDHPQVEGAADAHALLLQAIRGGDPAAASAGARRHVEAVIRRWSPDVWQILPHD